MPKLRVHNYAISVDGYAAGPDQDLTNPMGIGGSGLHRWAFATASFRGLDPRGPDATADDAFILAGDENVGATIMGRNMFGPVRGGWGDDAWRGWWGPNPPYHHPVFVLTNHPHDPIPMEGGTTFNFVTDGIDSALEQAFSAADGQDVRIGGGASTVQQYLRAGLVDELHLAIAPVLLGRGERLFDHLDGGPHGYDVVEQVSTEMVTHVRLAKR
jgi:dihydrofolate reductase